MDFDRLPTRPVVKSAISAQAEWEHWLLENHFQRLLDADGLDWNLELEVFQKPDEDDLHVARWTAVLHLRADVDVETFIRTGTLDVEEDARLISLIGSERVPLRMKPVTHEARGEKEAKDMLIRILPELRDSIAKTKLREIKRGLIGKWVDGNTMFGARDMNRP